MAKMLAALEVVVASQRRNCIDDRSMISFPLKTIFLSFFFLHSAPVFLRSVDEVAVQVFSAAAASFSAEVLPSFALSDDAASVRVFIEGALLVI